MKKLNQQQKDFYYAIDRILWEEWDPIGVNGIEDVRDEYDSYVSHLFSLSINGADQAKIASHLLDIERSSMGLLGNKQNCEEVAQKIIDARDLNFK